MQDNNQSSRTHNGNMFRFFFIFLLLLTGGLGVFLISRKHKMRLLAGDPEIPAGRDSPKAVETISMLYIEQEYQRGISDVCLMPQAQLLCKNNLGIPRKLMPQLDKSVAKKYYKMKQKQGIQVEKRVVSPDSLLPVQNQILSQKIIDKYNRYLKGTYNPCTDEITVSGYNGENRIIDGLHRTVTCRFTNSPAQHVAIINDSVTNILEELKHFPGVIYEDSNRFLFFRSAGGSDVRNQPKNDKVNSKEDKVTLSLN